MPSNPPTFPTLRQLYAWSTAQPETRRSGAAACDCPLALYWRDQGQYVEVTTRFVRTSDGLYLLSLPRELAVFVARNDRTIKQQPCHVTRGSLTPAQVRAIIETLEREAMLAALEECHAH